MLKVVQKKEVALIQDFKPTRFKSVHKSTKIEEHNVKQHDSHYSTKQDPVEQKMSQWQQIKL